MQTTSVNGIDIAYRIDGSLSQPWLALSNSLAADYRMWGPQMDVLTQTHRVLRYDTRGHGQTPATEGAYSFDMLVSDLVGLLDVLEVETADVLGLSLGGMTALGLALDHPERVSRLICCDARADAPAAYADGWRERIEIARELGLSVLADGTTERWLTDSFRVNPDNRDVVALCQDMILSTNVDGFCGCAAALTELNYAQRLQEIRVPTLCIVGDEDAATPPDVMQKMCDAIQASQISVIKGAAHISSLNQPEMFNAVLSDWL